MRNDLYQTISDYNLLYPISSKGFEARREYDQSQDNNEWLASLLVLLTFSSSSSLLALLAVYHSCFSSSDSHQSVVSDSHQSYSPVTEKGISLAAASIPNLVAELWLLDPRLLSAGSQVPLLATVT